MTRIIFSLCLLITSICFGQDNTSGQDRSSEQNNETMIRGEGWVIDLETDSVIYDGKNADEKSKIENTNNQAQRRKGAGIEFIVGGEGKDGIAKKATLPVDD